MARVSIAILMLSFAGAQGQNDWCSNYPGFKDSDGDDCQTIVKNGHCDGADAYTVAGVSAAGACCGCGGGVRSSESPTPCTNIKPSKRWGAVGAKGHCETKTDTRGKQDVAKNKMMFFGDSDIEYWATQKDFPNSVNCGVGGATAWEAAKWAKKTATKFTPKDFVVFVSGENDVGGAGSSQCVGSVFKDFQDAVMAFLQSPNKPTVIYFGTKPEPGTKDIHAWYLKYDKLIKEFAESPVVGGRLKVVDVHSHFKTLGNPKKLYDNDDLHMSAFGYSYWVNWLHNEMAGCEDRAVDWKDSDGDDCAKIRKGAMCEHADEYKVDGVGAKQACCACGGGRSKVDVARLARKWTAQNSTIATENGHSATTANLTGVIVADDVPGIHLPPSVFGGANLLGSALLITCVIWRRRTRQAAATGEEENALVAP